MATFGNTSIGGSHGGSSGNLIRGSKFTLSAPGGDVTKISWYGAKSTVDTKMKCAIYAKGTGGQPGALKAASAEVTINAAAKWWDFTVSPAVTLAADDYWIAFFYENNDVDMYYDAVDNEATQANTYGTGTPPDPYPASAFSTTKTFSIYATYTPTVTDTGFFTFF